MPTPNIPAGTPGGIQSSPTFANVGEAMKFAVKGVVKFGARQYSDYATRVTSKGGREDCYIVTSVVTVPVSEQFPHGKQWKPVPRWNMATMVPTYFLSRQQVTEVLKQRWDYAAKGIYLQVNNAMTREFVRDTAAIVYAASIGDMPPPKKGKVLLNATATPTAVPGNTADTKALPAAQPEKTAEAEKPEVPAKKTRTRKTVAAA